MKNRVKIIFCMVAVFSLMISNIAFATPKNQVAEKKEDRIMVKTDASGNVLEKMGSITIVGGDNSSSIVDRTLLTDISNISGDETYTQNDDGTIVWENKGNPINYLGSLQEELPFSMKIKYYLNDNEISPEELAGKSGHVKVEYSFENLKTVDVEMDGEMYHTYLPLLTVTSFFIPLEKFSNVNSLDGGLVVKEFGDQYFMMGVASPGTNDALNLKIIGLDQYVNFPDSFGFTADVVDFEMPSVVTYVTTHTVDKLDLSQIKTGEDINGKIDELINASKQIVNGSGELADGTNALSNGVDQYIIGLQKGLKAIADGSVQFEDELTNLEAKKKSLSQEAESLISYLDSILVRLNDLQIPSEDSIFSPELMEAEAKLKEDAAMLIEALEVLKGQLEEILAFSEEAQDYIDKMTEIGNTVYEELSAIDMDQIIADATELAKQQVLAAVKEEFAGLPISDQEMNAIAERIMAKVDVSSVVEEAKEHIEKVEAVLSDIPELEIPEFEVDVDTAIAILRDMEAQFEIVEGASEKEDEIKSLIHTANEFITSVKGDSDSLKTKSRELVSGLDFADDTIRMAHSYMTTLKDSASQADSGSKKLIDGVNQIDEGAQKLANGTKQYYEEGVLAATDYASQATLDAFINRIKAYTLASDTYTNISGKEEATQGSIGFIIRTDAISASK